MGLFQIPFLGSCPLLIAQKISLISLQLPFQSNAATDLDSIQSLSFFGKACLPYFAHRYSATDCKSQGSNIRIKGSPYYSLKTVVLSIICHRIPMYSLMAGKNWPKPIITISPSHSQKMATFTLEPWGQLLTWLRNLLSLVAQPICMTPSVMIKTS